MHFSFQTYNPNICTGINALPQRECTVDRVRNSMSLTNNSQKKLTDSLGLNKYSSISSNYYITWRKIPSNLKGKKCRSSSKFLFAFLYQGMINPGIICNLHLYYCLDESAQGETLVGTAKRWPKPLHFSVEVLNKASSQYFWVSCTIFDFECRGGPQKSTVRVRGVPVASQRTRQG